MWFRQARRKLRVSQKEIAKRSGISQSYVSELESGQKIGSPEIWSKLIWRLDDHALPEEEITGPEIHRAARHLAQTEPFLIAAFLSRFSNELTLRFHCPICKGLQPFKCLARDFSFGGPDSLDKGADSSLEIVCADCLRQHKRLCGGYRVKWHGRRKIQPVLLATGEPEARVSTKDWNYFDNLHELLL